MAHLLHIDSSPRGERSRLAGCASLSHSRRMTREFVEQWKHVHPSDIEARGDSGFELGGRYEKMNHHDPYLIAVFEFMGITDITFIHVEKSEYGGKKLTKSIANARTQIAQLVSSNS